MLKLEGFLRSLARYTRLIKQDAGLHLLSAVAALVLQVGRQ
jgi:hypothetical protein